MIDKVGGPRRRHDLRREEGLARSSTSRRRSSSSPKSAIAQIEYANGLILLFGKSRLAEATKLYEAAAACDPADAMERLDVERAKAELE